MDIGTYLATLKKCPDDRLTAELGIYDNYPVLLHADFPDILVCLHEDEDFASLREGEKKFSFSYRNGMLTLHAYPYLAEFFITNCGIPKNDATDEHMKLQQKAFNATLTLHPELGGDIRSPRHARVLATAVDDLARKFVEKQLPFCLPKSIGWDYDGDVSRIVYFPDEPNNRR